MAAETIIEFIIAIIGLIILHEFGHLIACKLFGVEVEEFGLGLPSPKAITLFEAGGPGTALSITLTVKSNVPTVVGVPEIIPVKPLRTRPPGKTPPSKDHV